MKKSARTATLTTMELLVFLLLAGVTAALWRRVGRLEREVRALRGVTAAAPAIPAKPTPVEPVEAPVALAESPPPAEPARLSSHRLPFPAMPRWDFEDLFGRLLPIWAGGVTLAVAGFFLVRWSIDAGLLTPEVRVVLAGLFGVLLIAGAETAYRWRERVADPRVAQALAGAGLATLYAAFYLAGTAYGLIASSLAFLGLAAVTAAAIALSFRFGLPSAVLGLVGGFAAPALVGSEHANLPLLTLYLALVTGGLAFTGRRQGRGWLGMAALGGGLGWGALLLASGDPTGADALVLGLYLVLLGAVIPAFVGGEEKVHWLVRVAAAALGALQLAVLVQQAGFGGLEWGLYLLLGAALAGFGWREPAMREGNAAAAAIGVALLLVWPEPPGPSFALVSFALAVIFGVVPLAQIARGRGEPIDLAQASGVALGLAGALYAHFALFMPERVELAHAAALATLAALPGVGAWLAARPWGEPRERWRIAAQAAATLLAYGALAQVLPGAAMAWAAAVSAAAVAWRAQALVGALAVLTGAALLWALPPAFVWLSQGLEALVGNPLLTGELPAVRSVALYLLPFVSAAIAWGWRALPGTILRRALLIGAAAVAVVAAHIVYRHAFAAMAGGDSGQTGMLERAGWEALLLVAAWLLAGRGWRTAAIGFAALALAHFLWFTAIVHNPLWSAQLVGRLPIANALVPAYAAGLAALTSLRRWLKSHGPVVRGAIDGVIMTAIALFALSELRQFFAGSDLVSLPIGESEDLLRSLAGIVLAAGFLLWGARQGERSWRIGSLVLMVIAVLKVFLVDAAGLAGLARIASFMALGFSLIAIGWFYNRQLRGASPPPKHASA